MRKAAKNNGKQRSKRFGGCTGKGFVPGHSGNPNGRPRTSGLLNVLKSRLRDEVSDGRTVEEMLVDCLLEEATRGKNRAAAIREIFDRVEGRPKQHLQVDNANPFEGKSAVELEFFAVFGEWPAQLPEARATELLDKAKSSLMQLHTEAEAVRQSS